MDGHRFIGGKSNRNFRACHSSLVRRHVVFVLAMASIPFPVASCSMTTTMATTSTSEPWSSASLNVASPEDSSIMLLTSTVTLLQHHQPAQTEPITADPILTTPIAEGSIHMISSTSTDDLVLQSDTISNISEHETAKSSELPGQNVLTTATQLSSDCCSVSSSSSWDIGQDLLADAVRMGDDAFFDIRPSLSSTGVGKNVDALSTPSTDLPHPSIDLVMSWAIDRQGNHALDKKDLDNDAYNSVTSPTTLETTLQTLTSNDVISGSEHSTAAAADVLTAALLAMTADSQPAADAHKMQDESKLAAGTIAGIALAGVGFAGFIAAALSVAIVRRVRRLSSKSYESQFANDNGGYLDSLQISYISSQTDILQESGDEMYSLDNDSFLNSLEAMTMVENGWSDDRRCTTV